MVVHARQRVFHHFLAALGAKQDAHGRIVAVVHLVFAVIGHVGVELPEIFVVELVILQLDNHIAMQNPVVEHQVGIIILVVDDDALLPCLKAEPLAQLHDKLLQMVDECLLQVFFFNDILRF